MAVKTFDTSKRKKEYASLFFVLFAILLGGYSRLGQVIKSDFPLNDGGMFYQMTVELQSNNYRLPITTSYNGLDIPFVYPPLPFYFIGLTSDISRIELLDLYRLIPGLISVLTIPAFYLLTRDLLENRAQTALAVICFALIPSSFDWLIMGGGITRAMGFLFSILTLQLTYRMYAINQGKYFLGVSVFAALTVLSHPEAAVHTIAAVMVLFWFHGRHKTGIVYSMVVAVLVITLTSPWWFTVINNHGVAPILSAGQSGWHQMEGIFRLWLFNFTNEINLSILGVLALTGFFLLIAQRKLILPTWLLFTFIFEPRSATLYITPILAMMAAVSLELLLNKINSLDSLRRSDNVTSSGWADQLFAGRTTKIAFAYLLTLWVFSANSIPIYIRWGSTITEYDMEAIEWIRLNIPSEQSFGVITGKQNILVDPVVEWFPILTKMKSVNTPQGREWLPGVDFNQVLITSNDFQNCAKQDYECIKDWKESNNIDFEYMYIRKIETNESSGPVLIRSTLEMSMIASGEYQTIYETNEVSILQKK